MAVGVESDALLILLIGLHNSGVSAHVDLLEVVPRKVPCTLMLCLGEHDLNGPKGPTNAMLVLQRNLVRVGDLEAFTKDSHGNVVHVSKMVRSVRWCEDSQRSVWAKNEVRLQLVLEQRIFVIFQGGEDRRRKFTSLKVVILLLHTCT